MSVLLTFAVLGLLLCLVNRPATVPRNDWVPYPKPTAAEQAHTDARWEVLMIEARARNEGPAPPYKGRVRFWCDSCGGEQHPEWEDMDILRDGNEFWVHCHGDGRLIQVGQEPLMYKPHEDHWVTL